MPGASPYEAVQACVAPLQRVIFCVSTAVLGVGGGTYISSAPHVLTLANGPERLGRTGGDGRPEVVLSVAQQYAIRDDGGGSHRVQTLAYTCKIDEAAEGHEILAYHWHPGSISPVRYPQLHLCFGARIGREEFRKAHLPTGRIALEDFVQFLIEGFEVRPAREDWLEVLNRTRQEFRENRSWA